MRLRFVPHSERNARRVARMAAALATLATLVAAVPALADPPTRVTIVAVFDPIRFGDNEYVNGQLFGDAQAGQVVALEQSAPPFTDWAPVAQVTSNAQGYYSFKLRPTQTMQYRTSSQGIASERTVQITVVPRIKLQAQAAGSTTVRFSGNITPALADQKVAIQRQLRSGRWRTIAHTRLRGGKTFQGRFHARHTTTLRAFFASNGFYPDAFSNTVTVVGW
jgi:hypothetical protein